MENKTIKAWAMFENKKLFVCAYDGSMNIFKRKKDALARWKKYRIKKILLTILD